MQHKEHTHMFKLSTRQADVMLREMIDLQADQDDQSCLSLGEDKDEKGTDGNLSDSESIS